MFAAAAVLALAWYWFAERPSFNLAREIRRRVPSLALAGVIVFLLVWAIYRFSFGKVYFADISLPAPEFFAGIRDVLKHNAEGHPGYLLGKPSQNGFWYFYLVDLAVKTPLALLILFFIGAAAAGGSHILRRAWLSLAFAAGILGVAMFSHINIGIRHVMPLYVGMCITAAAGLVRLIEVFRRPAMGQMGGLAASGLVWRIVAHQPSRLPSLLQRTGRFPPRKYRCRFRSGLGPGHETPRRQTA